MTPSVTVASLFAFVLVLAPLVCLLAQLARRVWAQGRAPFATLAAGTVCMACLLFRPHGDTFTALDHSGYRLMAKAFVMGRGFHEVDRTLLEIPAGLRRDMMLLPSMAERNTRDRSFLVSSLDTAQTEPFFYPFLSLASAGCERFVPFGNTDYVVPLLGLMFFAGLLAVALLHGGALGGMAAPALFLGSPLPLMLFRGFYAEAAGCACLGLAVCAAHSQTQGRRVSWVAYLALGLSISMHPVFVVLAVPLLALLLFHPDERGRDVLWALPAFALGVLPLVLMTELVCTPYGAFGWSSWAFNFRASATHRLALLFGGLSAFLAVLALITRPWWRTRAAALAERRWVWGILLVVALLPLCWTVTRWTEHRLVVVGLREAWGGVRRPLGCLLAVALAGGFLSRNSGRSQALWLVLIATLPVFAYLKGAEQMGMWSQRRLMPAYALLMLAATPWLAHSAKRLADASGARRRRAFAVTGLALFFAGPGLANLVRWPAPYLTRVEHGAWEWAQTVRAALGNRLAFFDYQPFSFALAVDNRTRAFGIGQQRVRDIPEVLAWLRERAATQTVLIVSAYAPPGIEDGVQLVPLKSLAFTAQRIASKGALPAETRETGILCNILAARPLAPSDRTAVLDKTFDRGPLALRGPWGRADIPMRLPDGKTLPAAWARQGSGMVGPVPPPGQSVAITVWASSAQKEPQRVSIVPPWSGPPVELDLPAQYAERAVRLTRPAGAAYDRATGVYSMSTERPYNPAADGVRGFDSDLVALIHRIRIEPVGNRQ